ncbi:MAG: AmmeMemoRadiSam system protein A [Acidaminococcaceae bacterium]|nr:AmmeMemoRadiSam system protein A [Acidaminococcaceae bacterium]
MAILGAVQVPHPPLILPEVGHGEEKRIQSTIDAFDAAAKFIADLQPDTVIISSPHSILYSDYFHISPGPSAKGSMAQFGAPQLKFSCAYDEELVKAVEAAAKEKNIPAGTLGNRQPELDHGTMVPMYFLAKYCKTCKIVRLALSGFSLKEHYRVGMLIAETAEKLGRKIAWIASGDLSHKLTKEGPYGFNPAGPQYDKKIMEVMGSGNFADLFSFKDDFLEEAAECGHRSFVLMAGAFDGLAVESRKLSYEGPFGVGYGVTLFRPAGPDDSRHFLEAYDIIRNKMKADRLAKEDEYVKLAREVIEHYVKTNGGYLRTPRHIIPEMTAQKAGVFVSLKIRGVLRGCIGTIGPMYNNVAEEIRHNAISACSRDPRFTPVMPDELEELEYSVDVLGPMEPISSPSQLDVKRYGVLVTKGSRSGLLLPNLPGVDTIEQQVDIAKQKAGIRPEENGCELQRFEVVRHY